MINRISYNQRASILSDKEAGEALNDDLKEIQKKENSQQQPQKISLKSPSNRTATEISLVLNIKQVKKIEAL